MSHSIYDEIKNRISLAEPGSIFLTSDFTDIAKKYRKEMVCAKE